MAGKAMFVCSNRNIAYALYKIVVELRPEWAEKKVCPDGVELSEKDKKELKPIEMVKMVMTRNKDDDPILYQMLGTKEDRKELDRQFKNVKSNFKIAIVVDMWLTGFDVPCLDTIYIDKPIQQHTLIQTISRVNRVYEGKDKGLIVDYLGIKKNMNIALKKYTNYETEEFEGVEQSVKIVKDQLEVLAQMFHQFNSKDYFEGSPKEQLDCLNRAVEYVQLSEELELRFMAAVKRMKQAFNLISYNKMCETIVDAVRKDPELQAMSKARLDENCYPDPEFHLLTMDIIYFGSNMTREGTIGVNSLTKQQGQTSNIGKNTILYGPPGTGKTYNTVIYAVAIIEDKPLEEIKSEPYDEVIERYNTYKSEGLIEFTTFHQSYGYEEFIEGIKPRMDQGDGEGSDLEYEICSGLFKSFCEKASQPIARETREDLGLNASPTVWKVSLNGTGNNPVRTECLENGHIRIGWDSYGPSLTDETEYKNKGRVVLNAFINRMKVGDIVLSCFSATTIDAIGVVTGDYEWHEEYGSMMRQRNVKWLVKGIQEDITELNGANMTLASVYKLNISVADVMAIVLKHSPSSTAVKSGTNNYVFIIDEINRGNISKVFGELITLIEPSKRIGKTEGMTVKLPYSGKLFGVPDNVYLIGTMNTADRSIATIDTALRRRFQFKEMQPDPSVLEGVSVEDISIKDMLERMNRKISILYDREHTIGHGYFIPLKEDASIEVLASIFENNIIPLLQEYFYDDYEKIRLVLGDTTKEDEAEQFIVARAADYDELFGTTDVGLDDTVFYQINPEAFDNIDAYRSI